MSDDEKSGYVAAYEEIRDYAQSMIGTAPDPVAWLDMALYAQTSIEDVVEGPLEVELTDATGG